MAVPIVARRAAGTPATVRTRKTAAPAPSRFAGVGTWLYATFVGAIIAFYSGARIRLSSSDETLMGGSDPLNTLITLVLLLGGTIVLLRHARRFVPTILPMLPFVLMLAVMLASASWSYSPENTVRRTVTMTALLLFALCSQVTLGPERWMRIALRAMVAAAVLSLLEAALRPAIGFDVGEYANAVRGLYSQKNAFGQALLAGALALSYGVLARGRLRLADGAAILFLLVVLVLSRSTTSLLLTLMVSGVTVVVIALGTGGAVRIATAIMLLVGTVTAALILFAVPTEALLDLIGKDASFTGRTAVWEAVNQAIALRPLTGYGYAAFWLEGSSNLLRVWDYVAWDVLSAHSGYLEVRLQLGLLGTLLVWCLGGVTVLLAMRAAWLGKHRIAAWALLLIGTMAILNRSESVLLGADLMTAYWVFAVLVLAGVSRAGRDSGVPGLNGPGLR
ncbi:O-antigen ligase family protein [Roseomonas populi]|uniref:O-antigen ligase family protein n=1 Tax=Roseomonas populi TaxID=3121582 RepID=A0ABT1X2K8_9PROT|nr:O-antigen ligase family protein [Roseomonas pecuniae]MCR0982327.1 O-antigen ligase family protein [Roseomonas pecuniae]